MSQIGYMEQDIIYLAKSAVDNNDFFNLSEKLVDLEDITKQETKHMCVDMHYH